MTPAPGPKAIYAMIDPRDGSVRYIGASGIPGVRFQQHLDFARTLRESDAKRNKSAFEKEWSERQDHKDRWAFNGWLDELAENNLRPDLKILTEPVEDWREQEREFQRQYGSTLLNPNDLTAYYARADVAAAVGNQLFEVRVGTGLTQSEAASLLNTSQAAVSRWESGDRTPSLRQVYRIAAAYGVPAKTLIPDIGISESKGASIDVTEARRKK